MPETGEPPYDWEGARALSQANEEHRREERAKKETAIAAEPVVLHYRTQEGQPYGSESRKCSECGVRLWIASDGTWTDDHRIWKSPPEGHVNCKEKRMAAEKKTGPNVSKYEGYIIQAFQDAVAANKEKDGEAGASPHDVTQLMAERGQLTELDTVIDITDLMKGLRDRGLL